MKMPFTITWEKITPEIAREFLTHNHKNRRLRKTTVIAYARDMRMGEWLANHQGIAFDKEGNLIDGQHRLAAVITSAVSIWALVARGVPTTASENGATAMDTIDRGAASSVADMLELGHGTVDANAVTAVCKLLANVSARDAGRSKKISTPQTLAVLELWKPHIAFAVENRAKTTGLRSAPVMTAIAFARAVKVKPVEEFYHAIISGEGLFREMPAFTIRNFLTEKQSYAKAGGERIDLVECILTAIHAHIKGEKMARVSANREAVEFFRKPQAAAIAKIEELFPQICEGTIVEALAITGGGGLTHEKTHAR